MESLKMAQTGQRKELVDLQFVFDANETKLTLDPEDSITSLKLDEVHTPTFCTNRTT